GASQPPAPADADDATRSPRSLEPRATEPVRPVRPLPSLPTVPEPRSPEPRATEPVRSSVPPRDGTSGTNRGRLLLPAEAVSTAPVGGSARGTGFGGSSDGEVGHRAVPIGARVRGVPRSATGPEPSARLPIPTDPRARPPS